MNTLARHALSARSGIGSLYSLASTSKLGFSTSCRCRSEDASPTDQTVSMQETLTGTTPAQIVGDASSSDRRQGGRRRPTSAPPPYADWVKGDGKQYEEAPPGRGPFWIDSVPFPLNKSFDPPPPVSHRTRQQMWHMHLSDTTNTVRTLSGKFGISMDRVHAILRLQALEAEWTKDGKVLQSSFQKNMERLLGAVEKSAVEGKKVIEDEASEEYSGVVPRAPSVEEFPFRADGKGSDSIIVPALKKEFQVRAVRRRKLPTGGPSSAGPLPSVQNVSNGEQRASMTIVDMSVRPTSYSGGGIVARNERRAKRRKQYRQRRATGK